MSLPVRLRLGAGSTGFRDGWRGWARRRGHNVGGATDGQQQPVNALHDSFLAHTQPTIRGDRLPQLTLNVHDAGSAGLELAPNRADGAEQAFAPGNHAAAALT